MDSQDRDKRQESDRAALGRGYAIAVHVMAISAMMVIFPLLGHWLDGKWGTAPLLLFGGLIVGIYATFSQLLRLSKANSPHAAKTEETQGDEPESPENTGPT